jgi:hypothetical protein
MVANQYKVAITIAVKKGEKALYKRIKAFCPLLFAFCLLI